MGKVRTVEKDFVHLCIPLRCPSVLEKSLIEVAWGKQGARQQASRSACSKALRARANPAVSTVRAVAAGGGGHRPKQSAIDISRRRFCAECGEEKVGMVVRFSFIAKVRPAEGIGREFPNC